MDLDHIDHCLHDDEDEPPGIADQMMMRGEQLRRLKLLCSMQEHEQELPLEGEEQHDQIDLLPNGQRILRYQSYLLHQRYYDDLKHVDCSYIDYGDGLIIEQDKACGKGGLCWDAAFILAEYVVTMTHLSADSHDALRVVELGAGTGLCGIYIASHLKCHVDITDLPPLLPLMQRNVQRNFHPDEHTKSPLTPLILQPLGTVNATVLTWGCQDDYPSQLYDVILGADVVASLYDPIALAETMWDLSHAQSVIYVTYKGRLTEPHEHFETRLRQLFREVIKVKPESRNNNPQVWLLKAKDRCDVRN